MGKKITAADVAREARVSPTTVDRVLNHRGGVSADKERRVFEAARRLGIDRSLDLRAARTLRVAALLQPPENAFHKELAKALIVANTGPNPYNIETRVFHVPPSESAAPLVNKIFGTHDAILLSLQQEEALLEPLGRFAASGKPVVTIATDLPLPGAVYIGPDNYQAGRLAGDLMGRLLGSAGGELLVIVGTMNMTGQVERRAGFEDAITDRHPNCRIVSLEESGEVLIRAGRITRDALSRHPSLKGIYNASAGVEEVVNVLEEADAIGRTVYVAHDLTEGREKLLASGAIDVVIDQDPALEVATALSVVAHAHGRISVAPESTETQVRVVFRENC